VNAGSLRGDFGTEARAALMNCFRQPVHVIASDATTLPAASPSFPMSVPSSQRDSEKINLYLQAIPEASSPDQQCRYCEPFSRHRQRSFFDLFRKRDS